LAEFSTHESFRNERTSFCFSKVHFQGRDWRTTLHLLGPKSFPQSVLPRNTTLARNIRMLCAGVNKKQGRPSQPRNHFPWHPIGTERPKDTAGGQRCAAGGNVLKRHSRLDGSFSETTDVLIFFCFCSASTLHQSQKLHNRQSITFALVSSKIAVHQTLENATRPSFRANESIVRFDVSSWRRARYVSHILHRLYRAHAKSLLLLLSSCDGQLVHRERRHKSRSTSLSIVVLLSTHRSGTLRREAFWGSLLQNQQATLEPTMLMHRYAAVALAFLASTSAFSLTCKSYNGRCRRRRPWSEILLFEDRSFFLYYCASQAFSQSINIISLVGGKDPEAPQRRSRSHRFVR